MRDRIILLLILTAALPATTLGQASEISLQAGLGYARVFDAGGISFAAGVDRSLSRAESALQHALGGSLWYAHTGIASAPDDPEGRDLYGIGVRYRVGFGRSQSIRPFLAVPVELLLSHIADRTDLVGSALMSRVPEPPSPRPVEDRIGGEWGWGTGLEIGFGIGTGHRLSGQSSVQLLYQNIYGTGTRNGAWNWHAGVSYGL